MSGMCVCVCVCVCVTLLGDNTHTCYRALTHTHVALFDAYSVVFIEHGILVLAQPIRTIRATELGTLLRSYAC